MTEYDFSPEAYHHYLATQQRIANWVETTEGHRPEYGNALAVTPSVASGHAVSGHAVNPVKSQIRSSQSQYTHSHVPSLQSRPNSRAPSRQPSAANLQGLSSQHSSAHSSPVPPCNLAPSQLQHPRTISKHVSSVNLHAANLQRSPSNGISPASPQPQHLNVPSQHLSAANLLSPPSHHTNHTGGAHTTQTLSRHAASHPKTLSRHHSSATLREHNGPADATAPPKSLSRHHSSATLRVPTEQLPQSSGGHPSQTSFTQVASRESSRPMNPESPPSFVVKVPPSKGTTYVYTPSGSTGLVILPSGGQNTSIVVCYLTREPG
ncbi:hypothetical protein H0H87_010608, partial [Tephrocybe sp. NHM501043]